MRSALEALRLADSQSLDAGYGSEIASSLDQAIQAVQYAIAVAEGRA